jgi:hypothetical protein
VSFWGKRRSFVSICPNLWNRATQANLPHPSLNYAAADAAIGIFQVGQMTRAKIVLEKLLLRWYNFPMIEHWTRFEGSSIAARRRQIRVVLGDKKDFNLNGAAFEALGEPEAVEMYFDEMLKRIGMKKCDPTLPYAFHLVRKTRTGFHRISAATFCNRFSIRAHTRVAFEGSYVDLDGILVLDLKKAIIAARAE